MADDARISTALPRHPKTVKLQRRLGPSGCWSLVCFFLWVAENRSDGDLQGLTQEDIEIAANWSGDAGEFARTLIEVRFLDGEEGAHKVHDWAEHNPWAANRGRRIAAAKLAAGIRWERNSEATRMRTACAPHETAMPTTQPNPTKPNLSSEQKSCSDQESLSSKKKTAKAPSQDAVNLAALLKSEILRNKPDYRITPAQLRKWEVTAARMLHLDGRKYEQVSELIRWVQHDEFWTSNVLSMDTLREKFDQLQLKKGRMNGNGKPSCETPLSLSEISRRQQEEREWHQ